MNQDAQKLTLPDRTLAYQQRSAAQGMNCPNILFLGGFASDMTGTKATFVEDQCAVAGYGLVRFDYRGHGASSGHFMDGCISDWFDDVLQVFDLITKGPQLLVASSMGGWLGMLLAKARPERIAGFVGLAAAPDFTEDMIRPNMTEEQKAAMERDGYFFENFPPNVPPEERIPITKKLIEDGGRNRVLQTPVSITGPIRLIQGQKDGEVPWHTAQKIADHIHQDDTQIVYIKDADHRLSRPQDLAVIWRVIEAAMQSLSTR